MRRGAGRARGVVRAVIRREYLQRVRSRWFVVGTVGAPLLTVGLMVAVFLMEGRDSGERRLVVVDHTGQLFAGIAAGLGEAGYQVEEGDADGGAAEASARARVRSGEAEGVLIVDAATLERGEALLIAERAPAIVRRVAIRQVVTRAALEVRLGGGEGALHPLLSGGELDVETLQATRGGDPGGAAFVAPYLGAFVLYMTILLYAVAVMRSVLEEKSNRVVEVVISAIRPSELMLGKILGVGAVGLTQLTIWLAFGVVILAVGIPAALAVSPDLAPLGAVREALPGPGVIPLFTAFFVGGYFMYAGLYAAVGAMCSTEEEAQQAQLPVILLLALPVIFLTGVIGAPGAPYAVVLSLIPFFTPVLMFARAALGAAPAWQVALSLAGMAVAVVLIARVAGRIYKVGILMTGKRPTLPELWRWVREA